MSVPVRADGGRFNRVRLEYIYATCARAPRRAGTRTSARGAGGATSPTTSRCSANPISWRCPGPSTSTTRQSRTTPRLIERYLNGGPIEIRTVLWFLPFFHHVYFGGMHTLLRFADHFARVHGVRNRFHCYDVGPTPSARCRARSRSAFPALAGSTFTSAADVPGRHAARRCRQSRHCGRVRFLCCTCAQVKAKFYFVQDNEPQFYPAGAASGMVEQTYRFGFPGIVNTPGLADVYRSYGNPAVSFVPAVDLDRYHPTPSPRDPAAPVRVFFYGRPRTPRNSFGLGIAALARLKQRCGDRVQIVCAGENWNPAQFGMAGRIENLGVLGRWTRSRRFTAAATSGSCSCIPSTRATSHWSSWPPAWPRCRTSIPPRDGCCATVRIAC